MTFRTILTTLMLFAVPLFLGCKDTHDHGHGEGTHHNEVGEGEGHDHDADDHDADDHAHEGEGHDHDGEDHPQEDAHDHAHAAGPHGGHVYVLGDDAAHAEMKHAGEKVTVWITTHEGSPLDAGDSVVLQLFSDGKFVDYSLAKTAEGTYEATDKKASELLEQAEHLKGRLHATIDGKKVTGVLEHHAHD